VILVDDRMIEHYITGQIKKRGIILYDISEGSILTHRPAVDCLLTPVNGTTASSLSA